MKSIYLRIKSIKKGKYGTYKQAKSIIGRKTKPLHGSQKIKNRESQTTTIELNIIINYEFLNLIMGYSDKVRIVEPEQLRAEIVEKAKQIITKNM